MQSSLGFTAFRSITRLAFISAWVCVRWLLRYIASHSFVPFAWYRIAFGVLVLLTWQMGWVQWVD